MLRSHSADDRSMLDAELWRGGSGDMGKGQKRSGKRTEPQVVAGQLRLIVVSGGPIGRRFDLTRTRMVVGRLAECEISVDNSTLSRRHAEIVSEGPQRFVVRDLESQNGTFVNGSPAAGHGFLRVGDTIRFGTDFVVRVAVHDPIEEQLRQAQRFEAVGRATAGIAHDFNNLLGAMIANLGYVRSLGEDNTLGTREVSETLADVQAAAVRASDLSDRLMHFARGERSTDEPVDVTSVLTEIAELVGRTVDRKITVKTDCPEQLSVMGDGLELHQVLMNLSINARDAMPDGGTLTLSARAREGPAVAISVQDTGKGMTAETRAQIFHPFFSTKHDRGYGLGLATVREIVLSIGGEITVRSSVGKGSCFEIILPRATTVSDVAPIEVGQPPPDEASRQLIVMIVDDEATVRRSIRRVVAQAGHRVIEAVSGLDAIACYERGPRPDVVALDVDMPGLAGEDTLERIRAVDPTAAVVMMSGHRDAARERSLHAAGARGFLRKPASMNQIIDTLEDVANQRPTAAETSGINPMLRDDEASTDSAQSS